MLHQDDGVYGQNCLWSSPNGPAPMRKERIEPCVVRFRAGHCHWYMCGKCWKCRIPCRHRYWLFWNALKTAASEYWLRGCYVCYCAFHSHNNYYSYYFDHYYYYHHYHCCYCYCLQLQQQEPCLGCQVYVFQDRLLDRKNWSNCWMGLFPGKQTRLSPSRSSFLVHPCPCLLDRLYFAKSRCIFFRNFFDFSDPDTVWWKTPKDNKE